MDDRTDTSSYFDVKQLQLLDVLYATRSVTKTAERLGQTQPTISTWLKQIRDKVGDPLFIRTSKEMIPTPRADLMVKKAREILEAMRQISGAVPHFDPATSTRIFRMCAPDSAHITMIPRLLQCIRDTAPNVQMETLPVSENTATSANTCLRASGCSASSVYVVPTPARSVRTRFTETASCSA